MIKLSTCWFCNLCMLSILCRICYEIFFPVLVVLLLVMASTSEAKQPSQASTHMNMDTTTNRPIFETKDYDDISVKGKGWIRILVLLPGSSDTEEVECKLIPGTILSKEEDEKLNRLRKKDNEGAEQETPREFIPYDALSWCWGKAAQDKWINIYKKGTRYRKFVQPDLVAALLALRHEIYERHIWVDAICINQIHKAEKNVGVQMKSNPSCVLMQV
jgi:hypothetical protein